MQPARTVIADAFPDSVFRHLERDAVVCVDVLQATTTLVTAVAQGRRAFAASTPAEAAQLAAGLDRPLLAGEAAGPRAAPFELPDSPAALARDADRDRPLVLCSRPGTELIRNAEAAPAALVACFRNASATAAYLARHHRHVAVLIAGVREELSCEDQMAAGRILARLFAHGFAPADRRTAQMAGRWSDVDVALAAWGNSASLLREDGRGEDVDFVLAHVEDVPFACAYRRGEVGRADEPRAAAGPVVAEAEAAAR
ncbi:MAG TPA: 2-phosphosulfolactate phosphatase [Vicinamibacteria bacterium]|jgi:phosphosulfolactate phosphohydrolase-like enzyme